MMWGVEAATQDREITVVAAADLHGHLPAVGPCDLLVLAGDLAPYDIERDRARCEAWFAGAFADWLAGSGAAETVAIAGNHDFWAEGLPGGAHAQLFGADWTYLQDAALTTRSGLEVYGTPWTRDDYDSAFEAPVEDLARRWAAIPGGLDILITHCPPHGHGDEVTEAGATTHMGTEAMAAAIARARPRLVVYGHAHQAHGYRAEDPSGTRLANVSVRSDYAGGLGDVSELALVAR
jgi:3',5'-cyclic AMP phosphodiesterase CpdA